LVPVGPAAGEVGAAEPEAADPETEALEPGGVAGAREVGAGGGALMAAEVCTGAAA